MNYVAMLCLVRPIGYIQNSSHTPKKCYNGAAGAGVSFCVANDK